jgi:hypothetical protein
LVGDDAFFDFVDECLRDGLRDADTTFVAARKVGEWLKEQETFFRPWEAGCADVLGQGVDAAEARHAGVIEGIARRQPGR